jgi:hypothetical protein
MDRRTQAILAALLAAALGGGGALARPRIAPRDWHDAKCAHYRADWSTALARTGRKGLSQGFLDAHDAFLASNCTLKAAVCPRSAEELAIANAMVIRTMNYGTASTFVPFACH